MQNGLSEIELLENEAKRFRDSLIITVLFLVILWAVKFFEIAFNYDFGTYGILPRTLQGVVGIATGPLIHGDLNHLLSNTFPLSILGVGIIFFYKEIAINVFGIIYILSGLWVWIAARDAFHIGASGIVYGFMFFIFVSGLIKRDRKQLAISFIVMLLYGSSMFTGLMPIDSSVSWEAHLTGALSGIFCALLYRNFMPTSFKFISEESELKDNLPGSLNHTSEDDIQINIIYKNRETEKLN